MWSPPGQHTGSESILSANASHLGSILKKDYFSIFRLTAYIKVPYPLGSLSDCLKGIRARMALNFLWLIESKAEVAIYTGAA